MKKQWEKHIKPIERYASNTAGTSLGVPGSAAELLHCGPPLMSIVHQLLYLESKGLERLGEVPKKILIFTAKVGGTFGKFENDWEKHGKE